MAKKTQPKKATIKNVGISKAAYIKAAQNVAQKTQMKKNKGTGAKATSRTGQTSFVVGSKTRKAQQELSDRFGIATFDTKGNISTTPSRASGGFSNIDVGGGRFASRDDFTNAVIEFQVHKFEKEAKQQNREIPSVIDVFSPDKPTRTFEDTKETAVVSIAGRGQGGFIETTAKDFTDKASDFVNKNKNLVIIVVIAFFGLMLLKRGKRR